MVERTNNKNVSNFEKLVTKLEKDIEIEAYYNCETNFDDSPDRLAKKPAIKSETTNLMEQYWV
uniref:Candidate secreted effector n=1 Tax=Meloidogyne incognita TaxID=6306 RepID=A0A914L270_MELIC